MSWYLTKKKKFILFYVIFLLTTDSCETCIFIQTCSCWNERRNGEQPLRLRAPEAGFWMWNKHYTKWIFPLWDRFSSFVTCHTLIPTSYIHDLSYLLVRCYYCVPQWSHACICILTQGYSVCLSAIPVFSVIGHLRTIGKVLRSPSESYRLPSTQPENS